MGHLPDGTLSSQGTIGLGNAGLAEIFLGQDIGSNLAPPGRHFHIVHFEYHFPARVADHRGAEIVLELIEYASLGIGEATGELQALSRLLFVCHKSVTYFKNC
jgi:hypothetical protein